MASKLFQNYPNHFQLFTRELIRKVSVLTRPAITVHLSSFFLYKKIEKNGCVILFLKLGLCSLAEDGLHFNVYVYTFLSILARKKSRQVFWIKLAELTKSNET